MKSKTHISALIVVNLFLIGCDNSEREFKEAESINTIEAYREFIQKFPEDEYTTVARDKIASISYENTFKENTEESYLNFIELYPGSEYEADARNMAAKVRYENIMNENAEELFHKFILDYPRSDLVDNARMKIDDIQNCRRYWSEEEFAEILEKLGSEELASAKRLKHKIIVVDGGNRITLNSAGTKRVASLPLFYFDEQNTDVYETAHLDAVLYREGIAPLGGVGIGEIYFWRRSLRIFYFDAGVSEDFQDDLHELHISKSKEHLESRREAPFSVLCTIPGDQ